MAWQKIEEAIQSINNRIEIDLYDFNELTEKSITVLGQAFNNIMYNRRLSVLTALVKEHKAKQLLKGKADIFTESYNEIFGETFREYLCSNLKTKQKYQEEGPPASSGRGGGR